MNSDKNETRDSKNCRFLHRKLSHFLIPEKETLAFSIFEDDKLKFVEFKL